MKISTKGRYALRLMLDLAINYGGELITVKKIAARQGISEKYLEQIITQLKKAGYVRSVRGSEGGYRLARDPAEYTVGMILRQMEGSLAPVSCLDEEVNLCTRAVDCITLNVWKKLKTAVEDVVDHITLADLVKDFQEKVILKLNL
jgi:Rrf2 family cysteine metabolism transcriptional repressor